MPDATTGGCLCGSVRFEIAEPLFDAGYCHCTRCQRRTGTAASPQARIPPGALRVTSGQELVKAYAPGDGGFGLDGGAGGVQRMPATSREAVACSWGCSAAGTRPAAIAASTAVLSCLA